MDLDDETLELLGHGQGRAYERLAEHLGTKLARTNAYMKLYMRYWRQMNPDKAKMQYKRYNAKRLAKYKADPVYKAAEVARKKRLRIARNKRATKTTKG